MGTHRTESERRRAARLTLGSDERPTLLPCPACDGQGRFRVEEGNRYRSRDCQWCAGSGTVDHFVLRLWLRWLRLRNRNRDCKAKTEGAG